MTYMALCDTSTCDKFNGSTAKWFKIDQIGRMSDGSTWYQQQVSAYRSLLSALFLFFYLFLPATQLIKLDTQ